MPKISRLPITRHHITFYTETWEYLESRFGPAGIQPIGVSTVVREIMHEKVLEWKEAENRLRDEQRRESRGITTRI